MRKTLLTLLGFFFSIAIYAQSMSLGDLVKILPMTWDDFDSYMLSKGYQFDGNKSSFGAGEKSVVYKAERGTYYVNKIVKWGISRADESNPDYVNIEYNTLNSANYLSLKSQLKTNGYKLISTENRDEHLWLTFRKGDVEVTLISGQATYEDGSKSTEVRYEISVLKYYGSYIENMNR